MLSLPKILCIDDTAEVRRLVHRLLSRSFVVLEADDGLTGIEMAVAERPDLILVDLHMPGLTGYEVATRLKSLLPNVPVVALTADVTDNVRERVLASGSDGYISKPLDPDRFEQQVRAYLAGEREVLADESFRQAYQQMLVARLEEKVRQLTASLERNAELNHQNLVLLERAQRRARLLEAGARVSRRIASILNLDALLGATVDALCDEFGFTYAGVFLLDETGQWAWLRAGRGEAGKTMVAAGYKLEVGGRSMVGLATAQRQARIALDVGEESFHFENPYLPGIRSEMALPLLAGEEVIGALTVQSVEEAAFDEDDIAALQMMADQLAVAMGNARLLKDLERAHRELMRSRTYEAIANATSESIHWVGNKAAPIPGSAARIREDVARYLVIANALLAEAGPDLQEHKYARSLSQAVEELRGLGVDVAGIEAELSSYPAHRLQRMLRAASILEDLAIIEDSARAILSIKEDLIGPARQRREELILLPDLVQETY